MEIVVEKKTSLKSQFSDILLDITWSKIAKRYFEKSPSWLYHKLDGIDGNGNKDEFSCSEKLQLKNALCDLAERIRTAADRVVV